MSVACHAIYLSPHLDDAIFSCGGQIADRVRRGQRILIFTLAAGDPTGELTPLAATLHTEWGGNNILADRREEDRQACAILGAECRHGNMPDAIYRRDPGDGRPLYPKLNDLFTKMHSKDPALASCIEELKKLPACDEIIAPLSVGRHVDHQVVRRAAEEVFGSRLSYYEDFPYAARIGAVPRTVWPPWRWSARVVPVSTEARQKKSAASAAYTSQVAAIFGSREKMEQRMSRQLSRIGGERLWIRK